MSVHPLAGQTAPKHLLTNIALLCSEYYTLKPDLTVQSQRVSFGTSGHRGSAADCAFNEVHIKAICQAVAEYRKAQGITGPVEEGSLYEHQQKSQDRITGGPNTVNGI